MRAVNRTIEMSGMNVNHLMFSFQVLILVFLSAAELPNEAVGN